MDVCVVRAYNVYLCATVSELVPPGSTVLCQYVAFSCDHNEWLTTDSVCDVTVGRRTDTV